MFSKAQLCENVQIVCENLLQVLNSGQVLYNIKSNTCFHAVFKTPNKYIIRDLSIKVQLNNAQCALFNCHFIFEGLNEIKHTFCIQPE